MDMRAIGFRARSRRSGRGSTGDLAVGEGAGEQTTKPPQCLTSMADAVFLLAGKLSHRTTEWGDVEKRVIAKAVGATGLAKDQTFDCISGGEDDSSVGIGQSKHTHEPGVTLGIRDAVNLPKEEGIVVGIAFACVVEFGPAGGVYTRASAEGVELDSAVVGHYVDVEEAGVKGGLLAGIGEECATGFLGNGDALVCGQIVPFDAVVAEDFPKLPDLSAILGGDEQAHGVA